MDQPKKTDRIVRMNQNPESLNIEITKKKPVVIQGVDIYDGVAPESEEEEGEQKKDDDVEEYEVYNDRI